MKIDIAKKDLLSLRDVLTRAVRSMEALPNPSSTADMIPVARKVNRKLKRAITKVYGHDCDCSEFHKY